MSREPADPAPASPAVDPGEDPCKSIFLTLADAAPDARRAELDRLARSDPGLHTRLAALLAAHDRAATPLDAPPSWTWTSAGTASTDTATGTPDSAELDAPLHPGDRFGPYTVESFLGSGAMGLVFAARHDGTNRLVALKLIRPDASSPAARRRFEAEGRALARLRHPGIAQVHDAGIANCRGQPLPYLAMELIDGRPITDAARDLPRPERVRLIERIARAVHHAHLNGVVHRDLKPANILIDASGDPKVLDFGVAKLTAADSPAMTTHAGQLIGTPAYMSPEQLGADPAAVDHRADVYALGALLFELLAGRRPIESEPGEDLWSVLRRVEQGPPSLGSVDPASRGDLAVITAVALRREPAERYQSAAELADDLARHLASQPIHARPRTRRYVMGRFLKRNPWPVALGAAAGLAVMAGTAGITVKQREAAAAEARAVTRFNETRQLARTVLFDLNDAIERLPGSTSARLLLASTAQSYLDRLAEDPAADDQLRLEIAEGYTRLGHVLGFSYGPNLGDRDNAIRNWRAALSILEPMVKEPDPTLRVLVATVQALQGMNSVLGFGITGTKDETPEWQLPIAARCEHLMARALEIAPDNPDVARLRAEAAFRHALTYWGMRETDRPLAMFADALARSEADLARWPGHHGVAFSTAETAFWYGYVLLELDRVREAEVLNDHAESLCRRLVEADPRDARTRQRLSTVIMRRALIATRAGDADAAVAACREAVTRFERHVAEDPDCQYVFRGCNVTHAHAATVYAMLESATDPADSDRRVAFAELAAHHARISADMLDTRISRGWIWPWEADYPQAAAELLASTQTTLDALTGTTDGR